MQIFNFKIYAIGGVIIGAILVLLFLNNKDKEIKNEIQNNYKATLSNMKSLPRYEKVSKILDKADFNFLQKGQDIHFILEKIGQPYEDKGFGCYIIVYQTKTGKVILYFDIGNKLDRFEFDEV